MIESTAQSALLLMLLPGIAVIAIMLNVIIRARGGRSLSLKVKAFGIDISLESSTAAPKKKDKGNEP